jgi:hypothetical protein
MSHLTRNQKQRFYKTADDMNMTATVRHDDGCENGHNTFSITLDAYRAGKPKTDSNAIMGGCCHDEVEQYFPELAHLIKWHLCSTDEPLHYLANTMYHASDKDCHGNQPGQPINPKRFIKFGAHPITYTDNQTFIKWLEALENFDLEVMAVEHKNKPGDYEFKPKYTFLPFGDGEWYKSPFDTEREALEFLEALHAGPVEFGTTYTDTATGKEPELEAARNSAIWPDATLDQLTDKDALMARLPALMAAFQADVEALGLEY